MQAFVVGIDVGGTNILAAVVARDGTIAAANKIRTPTGLPFAAAVAKIKEAADVALGKAKLEWAEIAGVGLAVPSSIDPGTGVLRHAPNLGWKNIPAREVCQAAFGCPVTLANDVNAGLYGEFLHGAARGRRSAAGFFVGTGLGGGLVIDGKLLEGGRGLAGEFGHMVVKYNGRHCGCGNRGCLEAYCSKVAFGKQFRRLICGRKKSSLLTKLVGDDLDNVRSKHLTQAYMKGDGVVCGVVNKGMRTLGAAAASLAAAVDVDCFVFGGGVIEALGRQLMPEIRAGFAKHAFGLDPNEVELKLSELGDHAVPLGAAALAWASLPTG